MKEIVPQKPMEPVLHGFLLKDRKLVPSSKSKVLKLFGLFDTGSIKPEKNRSAGMAFSCIRGLKK